MVAIISALQSISPTGEGIARSFLNFLTPTGEPQKGYMWEVYFSDASYSMAGGIFGVAPPNTTLHYYAQSVNLPESSIEVIDDHYMGERIPHAGPDGSSKNMNISFWDDQNLTVYQYFQTWMNQMHTADSFMGRQASRVMYMRDATLQLKDTTDLFINAEIKLAYMFPVKLGDVSFAYDNSDVMRFSVDFAYIHKTVGNFKKETVTPVTTT